MSGKGCPNPRECDADQVCIYHCCRSSAFAEAQFNIAHPERRQFREREAVTCDAPEVAYRRHTVDVASSEQHIEAKGRAMNYPGLLFAPLLLFVLTIVMLILGWHASHFAQCLMYLVLAVLAVSIGIAMVVTNVQRGYGWHGQRER